MSELKDGAQKAILKSVFDAALTDGERALIEAYVQSAEGREFAANTARFRDLLAELSSLKPESVAAIGLRARFEEQMRAEARQFQRKFAPFCLAVACLFALAGAVATFTLRASIEAVALTRLWILLGAGALVVCAILWEHTRRLLRSPDVVRFLRERRPATGVRLGFTPRTLFVLLLCSALLAPSWGWSRAIALTVASLVTLRVAALALDKVERRRRLREDERMWSWWYRDADSA